MSDNLTSFGTPRKAIDCVCEKRHAFADLDKIIVQRYQEPYGCTGGAYWYDGEWNYICPNLQKRVRILFFGNRELGIDYQQAKELEKSFKRIYADSWKCERRVEYREKWGEVPGKDFFNNSAVDDDPVGYGLLRLVPVTSIKLELA